MKGLMAATVLVIIILGSSFVFVYFSLNFKPPTSSENINAYLNAQGVEFVNDYTGYEEEDLDSDKKKNEMIDEIPVDDPSSDEHCGTTCFLTDSPNKRLVITKLSQ